MNAQFAHYWKEGVILTEEEREHQWKRIIPKPPHR